jgi:hypothetical protein
MDFGSEDKFPPSADQYREAVRRQRALIVGEVQQADVLERLRREAVLRHLSLAARYVTVSVLVITLGTVGAGITLIAEGLSRANNTLVALGVLCMVVALLTTSAGAWKLSAVGFTIERQPISYPVPHIPAARAAPSPLSHEDERSPPEERGPP